MTYPQALTRTAAPQEFTSVYAGTITAGTISVTGGIAVANLPPLAVLGDTLYEDATPAAAALPGNTAVQEKFLSQAGDGTISAAPAWAVVPGQYLCAPSVYAPTGAVASLQCSSGTLSAFGAGTVTTGSFTFPASGTVVVRAQFTASPPAAAVYAYALAATGTTHPVIGNVITAEASAVTSDAPADLAFIVGGTPGAAAQYDLLGAAASGTLSILAYGQSGTAPTARLGAPVVMTVQAT